MELISQLNLGKITLRGVSLGGVYTSIQIPEFGVLLDVGMPIRSFASSEHIFLSHAHADHVGGLPALLGIRGLARMAPPKVYLPAKVRETLDEALTQMTQLQRYDMSIDAQPMESGDEVMLRKDLFARAFRTHHPVPSLGYLFFDRVRKLKEEFRSLSGAEIARRKASEELFAIEERPLLAYATDTLVCVLETSPEILKVPTLILECTFLDERKPIEAAHAGCHIHLDDLLAIHEKIECENLVLMHFSQLYSPREVREILKKRCPPSLFEKIRVFAPERGPWPG